MVHISYQCISCGIPYLLYMRGAMGRSERAVERIISHYKIGRGEKWETTTRNSNHKEENENVVGYGDGLYVTEESCDIRSRSTTWRCSVRIPAPSSSYGLFPVVVTAPGWMTLQNIAPYWAAKVVQCAEDNSSIRKKGWRRQKRQHQKQNQNDEDDGGRIDVDRNRALPA